MAKSRGWSSLESIYEEKNVEKTLLTVGYIRMWTIIYGDIQSLGSGGCDKFVLISLHRKKMDSFVSYVVEIVGMFPEVRHLAACAGV